MAALASTISKKLAFELFRSIRLITDLWEIVLGFAAINYIGVGYLRFVSLPLHAWVQPLFWTALAIASIICVPFYNHWSAELRSTLLFIFAVLFMLFALLIEAISIRSVTAVLGLDWHNDTPPLPDVGQWLLLALNKKLPETLVGILRARIIGWHHFLMLLIMFAFSALLNSVEAPGLRLGARYTFTMGVGRQVFFQHIGRRWQIDKAEDERKAYDGRAEIEELYQTITSRPSTVKKQPGNFGLLVKRHFVSKFFFPVFGWILLAGKFLSWSLVCTNPDGM